MINYDGPKEHMTITTIKRTLLIVISIILIILATNYITMRTLRIDGNSNGNVTISSMGSMYLYTYSTH